MQNQLASLIDMTNFAVLGNSVQFLAVYWWLVEQPMLFSVQTKFY